MTVRPISSTVLARHLAATITSAACKGMGVWWSAQEAAWAAAQTPAAAAEAVAPAMSVCAGCPEREAGRCAQLAEADRYTGLAAGAAYVNGRAEPVGRVRQNPTPPHLRRAG